jgi:hypothetical protein
VARSAGIRPKRTAVSRAAEKDLMAAKPRHVDIPAAIHGHRRKLWVFQGIVGDVLWSGEDLSVHG